MTEAARWLDEYALAIRGEALSSDERELILALAGVAAHAAERTAAPLTCWIAATAGLSPEAALETARELAARFAANESSADS
ncbi:MAG TPA: DUF6457 domain-containing protein [Acidimicrobiales bacterium]|nr:MAG: hypothetical protein B7X07_06535 [Actinobacteria bacterium 21-64-8]HQU00229.1 DUF6457 domain-containing protein [Acidimicrobiales bacterium]